MRVSAVFPLLFLAGCYASHSDDTGVDAWFSLRDGGPIDPVIDAGPGPSECRGTLFLLGAWDLPTTNGMFAHGSDLDGVVSTGAGFGCADLAPDFTSLYTGEPGVDNQFATLATTIESLIERPIADVYREQVASGTLLYAIEVIGAESPIDDPSVTVIVHRATAIDGLRLLPDGMPASDQRLALEPVSQGPGSIVGGWVTAELSPFELAFDPTTILAPIVPIVFRTARVRFQMSCDGGSLGRAELAGTTAIDDVVEAVEHSMPGLGGTVRSLLGNIADSDPSPSDPSACSSLSFAYTFQGVVARR